MQNLKFSNISNLCFVCLSTIFMLLRLQRHLLVHLGLIRVASAKNSNRRRILVINIVYRFSLLSKFQNSTSALLIFQKCCNNHVGRSGTGFSYCKLNRCSCITIGRELTDKKVLISYLEFRPIRCVAQDLLYFGIPIIIWSSNPFSYLLSFRTRRSVIH